MATAAVGDIRPGGLLGFIPSEHVQFIKGCRNYYETVGHMLEVETGRVWQADERGWVRS